MRDDATRYATVDSPVGPLTLIAQDDAIVGLRFAAHRHEPWSPEAGWKRADDAPLLVETAGQLAEYFAGGRAAFDVPMQPRGTAFQRAVWAQLCRIGFGETISYGELARRVGDANAARAVGMANGRNPIAILVPCHRVIGASGKLVGFGGGVDVKRLLLDHERAAQAGGARAVGVQAAGT